jgi:chemotaxis protein methyltransferase CheR
MTISADHYEAARFRGAIARSLGLHFDDAKFTFLSEQLKGRLEVSGQSSDAYLAQLEVDPPKEELRALARILTVGETYFFRNSGQFQAMRELALPERWRAQMGEKRLRILSAGCASGEEAYSIAIVAREILGDLAPDVSIRAVDINPAVLDRAMRARYNSWAMRETPVDVRDRWFRPDGHGSIVLDPAIRAAVKFEECNLMDEHAQLWRSGTYDIIFCRNVLMYFSSENMQVVVRRIVGALAPGGYLFLGHAETLRGISQDFHLCHTHDTFYYRLREAADRTNTGSNENLTALERQRRSANGAAPQALEPDSNTWADLIHKASERIRALAPNALLPAQETLGCKDSLALALDLLQSEHYAQALALVQALPAESRRDPDTRLLHAVLMTHSLQLPEAEELCQQLLADDELNAGAHYLLALCRERAGDHRGASEHDQYAIYLDPAFAMPRLHLGLVARRNHDTALARRELAQAHILLQREDASRLLLFGGGFGRDTLLALCRAELRSCGGQT